MKQLKKLKTFVGERVDAAARLSKGLKDLKGLRTPVVKTDCTHVYYGYPLLYDEEKTGIPRDLIVKALQAEGVPASGAYVNLHLLPMYQHKIAYGTKGFPWSAKFYKGNVSYQKGSGITSSLLCEGSNRICCRFCQMLSISRSCGASGGLKSMKALRVVMSDSLPD